MTLPRYRRPPSVRPPLQAAKPTNRYIRGAFVALFSGLLFGGMFATAFSLGVFLARAISRGTPEAIKMLEDPSGHIGKGELLWGLILAGPVASVGFSLAERFLKRYKWFSEK